MGNSLAVVYDEILFCVYEFLKLEVFFFLVSASHYASDEKKKKTVHVEQQVRHTPVAAGL